MKCSQIVRSQCPVGHVQAWECYQTKPSICKACEKKRLADEKKAREDFDRQQARASVEQQYAAQIAELDDQIRLIREQQQDTRRSQELMHAVEQKKRDLDNAKVMAVRTTESAQMPSAKTLSRETPVVPVTPLDATGATTYVAEPSSPGAASVEPGSPSELEWERMKLHENIRNDALDSLMKMTGLEHVKQQFLTVKARIDTSHRQGTDLKKERFGAVLLGNPGTGMPSDISATAITCN